MLFKLMMVKQCEIIHWESWEYLQRQSFSSLKQTKNIIFESFFPDRSYTLKLDKE